MNGDQVTEASLRSKELLKPTNQKVAEAVAKLKSEQVAQAEAVLDYSEEDELGSASDDELHATPTAAPVVKVSAKAKAKAVPKAKASGKAKPAKAKAKAKAGKVKTPKAVKKAKKVTKAKSAKPTSGQSGPALELEAADLNKNETKLLCSFGAYKGGEEISIAELAKETFATKPKAQANSWTRNSLRRLVRGGLVEKTERGTYKLTKAGRGLV